MKKTVTYINNESHLFIPNLGFALKKILFPDRREKCQKKGKYRRYW